MIQNARVLREHYVPQEIEGRNQELNDLSRALAPIEDQEVAEDVFLFGPSGTGKTAIARYTLNELEREVLGVTTQYINCWDRYSRFGTLHDVIDGFTSTVDIHRQSTATDELLSKIKEYDGPPYVVVLDEADQLQDKKVLYDLYEVPNISMIMISNEENELFAQLGSRLHSRLHSARKIRLDRYSLAELADILEFRAQHALVEGAVSRENLELISDMSAGDARIGIGILRVAAGDADYEGAEIISAETIDEAASEARRTLHQKTLDQLREDQRLIYDIFREYRELEPAEVYELYGEQAEDPKTNRTVRNHLQKLQHYNLIIAEGEKRARTYRIREVE
jgi:orc1/cdc6 family replication initiation protein